MPCQFWQKPIDSAGCADSSRFSVDHSARVCYRLPVEVREGRSQERLQIIDRRYHSRATIDKWNVRISARQTRGEIDASDACQEPVSRMDQNAYSISGMAKLQSRLRS